ncbi:MAG: hypothetical protein DRO36_03550 [Candidatus Hecatellales archaeon]|mgnify:CR=1 FL=1|nr:MAG: hypothetical protein DRO36_03550 [Candidatus Hecatellales archaeon]
MDWLRGYDRYLAHIDFLVKRINAHLPKNRKSLLQLLNEDSPYVEATDGSKIYFKKRDIEEVSKILPKRFHGSLMLPILIVRRIKLGKGVFTVMGGRIEKHLVKKVLGLTSNPFEDFEGGEVYLYKVQVQELLSKLGSLIVIGFEVPEEEF